MDWLDSLPESPLLETEQCSRWWDRPASPAFSSDKLFSWPYTPTPLTDDDAPLSPSDVEKFCPQSDPQPLALESEEEDSNASMISGISSPTVQNNEWTAAENKQFENAIAEFDFVAPETFEQVASRFPGRSAGDIKQQYESLVQDIRAIESGEIALPKYRSLKGSSIFAEDLRRTKGKKWTSEEHRLFLMGLERYGKGAWKSISRNYVVTRTPTQVASHAQKFLSRVDKWDATHGVGNDITSGPSWISDTTTFGNCKFIPIAPAPFPSINQSSNMSSPSNMPVAGRHSISSLDICSADQPILSSSSGDHMNNLSNEVNTSYPSSIFADYQSK